MRKMKEVKRGVGLFAAVLMILGAWGSASWAQTATATATVLPTPVASDVYQLHFYQFVNGGTDNKVEMVNPNVPGAATSSQGGGALCAMVYVFDAHEELMECCGCPVSKNGLRVLSTRTDLTSNLGVTGEFTTRPEYGLIKIISAAPNGNDPRLAGTSTSQKINSGQGCDPTGALATSTAVTGSGTLTPIPDLRASLIQPVEVPAGSGSGTVNGIIESAFQDAPLYAGELNGNGTAQDPGLPRACAQFPVNSISGSTTPPVGVCLCGIGDLGSPAPIAAPKASKRQARRHR